MLWNFLGLVLDKLSEISRKTWILIIVVCLLGYVWVEYPNPWSVNITPLSIMENTSVTTTDKNLDANTAVMEEGYSALSEVTSALGNEHDTLAIFEKMASMTETANNLKMKDTKITIPENVGVINLDDLTVYEWKKTYCRFLINDAQLYQDNIMVLFGDKIIYIYGGQNGYFSFNYVLSYGTLK